jgi:hypothetical protein
MGIRIWQELNVALKPLKIAHPERLQSTACTLSLCDHVVHYWNRISGLAKQVKGMDVLHKNIPDVLVEQMSSNQQGAKDSVTRLR